MAFVFSCIFHILYFVIFSKILERFNKTTFITIACTVYCINIIQTFLKVAKSFSFYKAFLTKDETTVRNLCFRADCTESILQRRLYGIYALETTVRNLYFRADCTESILQRRLYGIYALETTVRNLCCRFLYSRFSTTVILFLSLSNNYLNH